MVACTAAVLVLAIRLVNLGSLFSVLVVDVSAAYVLECIDCFHELEGTPLEIGCAVTVAWFIQAVSGRWQSEPSWIDRMGRILGVFWVSAIPFAGFSFHISR